MKLCYFNDWRLGVIKGDAVVDVTDAVKDIPHIDTRDLIIGLIAKWDSYKAKVEKAADEATGMPLKDVRLRPPVPKPGNIVCMAVNYMEDGTLKEKPQINAFHKARLGGDRRRRHHGAARRAGQHLRGRGRACAGRWASPRRASARPTP